MAKWILDFHALLTAINLPTYKQIENKILATNNEFVLHLGTHWGMPIAECENKPEGSIIFGIDWIKIEGD
jgi:hypothetical protein